MARTMKMGKRAKVSDMDFPDPYKCKKGYIDIVRIISKDFIVYDLHRERLSASSYVYANCPDPGNKKKCPLCKAGNETTERYAVEILHIGRKKVGSKKVEVINEVIPWAFAGRIQNNLTDLYDEEGPLTGYNIKLTCREKDEEQFQKPTITKTKGKLDDEQKALVKEKRGKVAEFFTRPSTDDHLKKMAAKLEGEDYDEDEEVEDMDTDVEDEDFDDDGFEDEEFEDAIAEMEDEDDDED